MQSIEDLIAGSQNNSLVDDESTQGKFKSKQKEINIKEMERVAQSTANNLGLKYINLDGFPISPEAISLIKEKEASELGVVCFYYDGKNIKVGAIDSTNKEVKQVLQNLKNKYLGQLMVGIYLRKHK